ncbi:MAG: S-layer homology domain-containing protein [Cyanobacteria bacterium P01_G01_bin.19]
MTNSSPQEPQNTDTESRKRIAGLTYDELIAIFVAFSTIGSILFWSFGSKIGNLAGNLGLGRQGSLLSKDIGIGIGSINADSDVSFGEIESDTDSFDVRDDDAESESSMAASARKFSTRAKTDPQSFQFDTNNQLASFGVGAAGITVLGNRSRTERDVDSDNAIVTSPDQTPTAVTPEVEEEPIKDAPAEITPDQEPDTTEDAPVAVDPENIEMPDDVVPDYWAYPFVKQMSDRALVAELTEDQDFEPDKLITRASMATLISQAFSDRPEVQGIKQFDDVTNENAISADIDKAVRIGFMQGYSDDEFRPLDNIPRYQVLVTLATGLGLQPSTDPAQILQQFNDGLDLPDWAKSQVAAASEAGLIVNRPGFADEALNPNAPATRAEVAAMIHQALVETGKLEPIESEYIIQP